MVTFAVGAVAFGAAAWLLLGPVWTVAGVFVGLLIAVVVVAVVHVLTAPDAATLLSNDQPDEPGTNAWRIWRPSSVRTGLF